MYNISKNLLIVLLFNIFLIDYALSVVVSWGEECQFTAECGDHRLVCEEITVKNITSKICVCDRFHEWNGTLVGCVLKYTTNDILDLIQEKYNVSGRIEYEANIVFLAQVIAGLMVMSVGLLCSTIVIGYCYRMWKMDKDLEDVVKRLESQKQNFKPTTSRQGR